MSKYTFYAADEPQVVGTNPEMSDYDNPRGEIIQTVWFVVAECEFGTRFRAYYGDQAACEAAAIDCNLAGLDPENAEGWGETYPVYGSEASVEDQAEIAERELCGEDR